MSILNLGYSTDYSTLYLKSGPTYHASHQIFMLACSSSAPDTIYPVFISRLNEHDDFIIYCCIKRNNFAVIIPESTAEMIASLGIGEMWYFKNVPSWFANEFKTRWTYVLSPSGYLTYSDESNFFSIYYLNKHYFDIFCASYGLKL